MPTKGASFGLLGPEPGRTWQSLLPADVDETTRMHFQLLDEGVLEAWQDASGEIHLFLGATADGVFLSNSPPWPADTVCRPQAKASPSKPGQSQPTNYDS